VSSIHPPGWFQTEVARLGNLVLGGRMTKEEAIARLSEMIVDGGGEFLEEVLAAEEAGRITLDDTWRPGAT
jgi:hypothetical protein